MPSREGIRKVLTGIFLNWKLISLNLQCENIFGNLENRHDFLDDFKEVLRASAYPVYCIQADLAALALLVDSR